MKTKARECYERLTKLGEDYAKKKAAYEKEDEMRKIVFSGLFRSYNSSNTAIASEHHARCDALYLEAINKVEKAQIAFLEAWAKLEADKIAWEVFRTEAANNRVEQRQSDRGI